MILTIVVPGRKSSGMLAALLINRIGLEMPALLTDVAVTAAVAVATFSCGGGFFHTLALTERYEPTQP